MLFRYCFVQFFDHWDATDYADLTRKILKIGHYESNFTSVPSIEKCLPKIHMVKSSKIFSSASRPNYIFQIAREVYHSYKAAVGQQLHVTFDMFIDFVSTINIQYESKLTSLKSKRDKCASSIKV
jgi:hypothetical protein